MASYNELNALIDAYINRNGVQAITGQILNGVLKAMVEQLGRGYTIMGAATPTTDPGTPDGPECYFASTPGTYTDFDGLQVAPGELALLCYTPSDGWTKATIYEGFQEVGATIDGNVGTPSVGVSYANGVLSFDFHNMKGNPGQNGQDGAAAGFGTIGADITGGVGTPAVSVESSGPATAKNLQFHFTNLKGETGVTSVVATVDNTTGTPACTVSLVGQQLTLAFTGLKGAQGDTGSSVDYPFTIVNNLTTDDATQALSAAQGVVLDGKVTQLEAEETDLRYDVGNRNRTTSHDDLTVTTWTDGKANIADSNDANFGSAGTSSAFSITDKIDISAFVGKTLTYTRWVVGTGASANTKKYGLVFYNSSNAAVSGQQVDVSGEGGFSETSEITVPSNAKYVSFTFPKTEKTNFSAYVGELVIGDFTSGLGKRVQDLESDVDVLENKMDKIYPAFTILEKCTFNGTSSVAEFTTPVLLSQNGDSIEITVSGMESTNGNGGGYAFCIGGSTSKIGIAAGLNVYGVRVDDGTWIGNADSTNTQSADQVIKVEYKDGNIYYTANNGEKSTVYTGQKDITIKGFGHTGSTYGYWKGSITQLKINGQVVYLSEIATLTDVTVERKATTLTPEQIVGVNPPLMFQKGADYFIVYRRVAGTKYVRYGFGKYTEAYERGDYPNNYDVWRITDIHISEWDGTAFVNVLRVTFASEFEMAVNAMSAEDTPQYRYVGGIQHGFDKIMTGDYGREFRLLVDDKLIAENEVVALRPIERIELLTGEELFKAYSEDDKFAEVSKRWEISVGKELEITMGIKFTAAIAVEQLQMGMFGCYRRIAGNTSNDYLTDKAIKDSVPFRVFDVSDGWNIAALINNDHECKRIVEYGDLDYGFALETVEDNRTANGGMMVRTNNSVYNKIYFDVTGEISAQIGDEYHAKVRFSVC